MDDYQAIRVALINKWLPDDAKLKLT